MKPRARLMLLLVAALLVALAYTAGALAPPLFAGDAADTDATVVTMPMWTSVRMALDLLSAADDPARSYLPAVGR